MSSRLDAKQQRNAESRLTQELEMERARGRTLELENKRLLSKLQAIYTSPVVSSQDEDKPSAAKSEAENTTSASNESAFRIITTPRTTVRRTSSASSDFSLNATITPSQGKQQQQHQLMRRTKTPQNSVSSDATITELQNKLQEMAREKATLESAMEIEQERMFNQSRRLSGSISPLFAAADAAANVGSLVSPRWAHPAHSRSSSVSSSVTTTNAGIVESLKADITSLRIKLADAERELVSCYTQSQVYKKELVALRQRLGMEVDDLYLDDPVPSTLKAVEGGGAARRQSRSRSVSSSSASTPSFRGSAVEYFPVLPPTATARGAGRGQRPRSLMLSPRRSIDDPHYQAAGDQSVFGAGKSTAAKHMHTRPHRPH